jgi:oxygen-dependent protoporphyrinogen oxidase
MDVVTVYLGGALDRDVTSFPDDTLRRLVTDDLARALPGVRCRDVRLHRLAASIPQYERGHAARMAALDDALAALPGLHAIGAYRDGIALPDRVTAGETTAQRIVRSGTA